jgi:uncharacterized SAM-binding protein YcdF (DUF218 family)
MHRLKWLLWTVFAVVVLAIAAALWNYESIPLQNTAQDHFDVIIVLGYPAEADGTPSPVQRTRVMEGVREYQRGVANILIMTGGAAHNNHVEADAMGDFAISQGIPLKAVLRERQAHDTIQNAYYSWQIMQARGWKSAEIVSSASHLPRASLIYQRFPIAYKMHAAPDPREYGPLYTYAAYLYEARNTARIRLFGFKSNRYLP